MSTPGLIRKPLTPWRRYPSSAVNCLPSYIHISTALSLLWYGSNVCFSKAGAQSKAFEQCNALQNAPISMQFYLDEALLPASPFLHTFKAKKSANFQLIWFFKMGTCFKALHLRMYLTPIYNFRPICSKILSDWTWQCLNYGNFCMSMGLVWKPLAWYTGRIFVWPLPTADSLTTLGRCWGLFESLWLFDVVTPRQQWKV